MGQAMAMYDSGNIRNVISMVGSEPKLPDCTGCDFVRKLAFPNSDHDLQDVETDASASQPCESRSTSHECTDDEIEDQQEADKHIEQPLGRTAAQIATQIEIERASHRVDSRLASVNHLQNRVSELEDRCFRNQASQVLLAELDRMRKHASNYAEDLLEDMLGLDKLSGLASDDRASRKAIIAWIEAALDGLDGAKAKLNSLHLRLEREIHEVPAASDRLIEADKAIETSLLPDPAPHRNEFEFAEQQQTSNSIPALIEVALPRPEFWDNLPLQLPFQERIEGQQYVVFVAARNFNAHNLQLQLSEDRQRLFVRGTCLPTRVEALQLQNEVRSRCEHSTCSSRNIASLYAEAAQGRFGTFSNTLIIPADVNTQGISASVDEGNLCVVLPKRQPRVRIHSRQMQPSAHALHGPARYPLSSGFLGRDL